MARRPHLLKTHVDEASNVTILNSTLPLHACASPTPHSAPLPETEILNSFLRQTIVSPSSSNVVQPEIEAALHTPEQRKTVHTQATLCTPAASKNKKASVNVAQLDDEDEVEIVLGPPQYNCGKTVLGGSNPGKRNDSTNAGEEMDLTL